MDINELIPTLLVALTGVFVGFAGYKCFRACITLLGALIGGYTGVYAYEFFGEALKIDGNNNARIITIAIFVIAFASMSFALYRKAIIYITAMVIGFWIYGAYITSEDVGNVPKKVIVGILSGLVGLVIGYAVFAIQKWAIMINTSIIGAKITATALTPVFVEIESVKNTARDIVESVFGNSGSMSDTTIVMGLLLIALSVAGFIVQVVNKE